MKLFLINLSITIILYTIVYLIKSFVIWDLTNPFQWIIDIPKYDAEQRGLGLFAFVIWQGFQIGVISYPFKNYLFTKK
jgi:hypothetical protein